MSGQENLRIASLRCLKRRREAKFVGAQGSKEGPLVVNRLLGALHCSPYTALSLLHLSTARASIILIVLTQEVRFLVADVGYIG